MFREGGGGSAWELHSHSELNKNQLRRVERPKARTEVAYGVLMPACAMPMPCLAVGLEDWAKGLMGLSALSRWPIVGKNAPRDYLLEAVVPKEEMAVIVDVVRNCCR